MRNNKINCTLKHNNKDFSPDKLSAKDLADFIANFEKALFASTKKIDSSVSSENFLVSLTQIHKGSVQIEFTSTHPTQAPIYLIAQSINTTTIGNLPREACESVQAITKTLHKLDCTASFGLQDGSEPLLLLEGNTLIPDLRDFYITGETSLYGQLVKLGGRNEISADIKPLDNGQLIHCRLTQELAQELSPRLYQDIGVNGFATWDIETCDIKAFEIIEILPYQGTNISDAVENLAHNLVHTYKHIKDVHKYIQDLRGDQ